MLRWLVTPLLLIPMVAQAEVYRWLDEQGNVVFSDQPRPGAERLKLPEITTYEALPYAPATREDGSQTADEAVRYDLGFVQPAQNETIRDNQGNVLVLLQVEPPLRTGHRIVMRLDRGAQTVETTEPSYLFSGIHRGTHSIQAWVLNAQDERIADVAQTVFHLHQASRLFEPPPPPEDGNGGGDGDPNGGDGEATGPVRQAPRAPMAPRFQYNPTPPASAN